MGWSRLQFDAEGCLLQPGGITLSLSAIAKGYAVDAVAGYLDSIGARHHLVEIGGELRGTGVRSALQPWWVGVELPAPDCTLRPTRVALHGLSIATSGDYRRFLTRRDERLPHTIDPRTRRPVSHQVASVTVLHPSCMWADAWATALMVLGAEDGMRLAEAENLAALLQWRDADGAWIEATSSTLRALEA